MTTFSAVVLPCPICQTSFESRVVEGFSIAEKEADFCPRYVGVNPLPFLVHVCPSCGFAAVAPEFVPMENDRQREKLARWLESVRKETMPHGVEKFRRAALIAAERSRPPQQIADLYLKGAWCARIEGVEGESQCRRHAIQYFELAAAAQALDTVERQTVAYLLGELSRRAGNFEKARRWFDSVDAEQAEPWVLIWRDRQRAKLPPPPPPAEFAG